MRLMSARQLVFLYQYVCMCVSLSVCLSVIVEESGNRAYATLSLHGGF